jgi:A/G-specific adenine glycosylase
VSTSHGIATLPHRPSRVHLRRLSARLLDWYERNKRDLPWRQTADPYRIWVSEVMLQQTQVATVIPYYERFLARFPTLQALAQADPDETLQVWQGLGYYSRARNLLAGARHIVREHGGAFPRDEAALRKCPGIGEYTAGALLSIAFHIPAAAVDGNVERVLCRLIGADGDVKREPLRGELRAMALALVPAGRASETAQALMELGATVCTPKGPHCGECPWERECVAREQGRQEAYPRPRVRKQAVDVALLCAVVVRQGRLLIEREPGRRFWKQLWTLPYMEAGDEQAAALSEMFAERFGAPATVGGQIAEVKCGVTHHRITLRAYSCEVHGEPIGDHIAWVEPSAIGEYALPTAHRKLIASLAAEHPGV